MRFALSLLFLCALPGCDSTDRDEDFACTTEFVYGLVVTVADAATDAPPEAEVTLTVTDGDYVEVVRATFDPIPEDLRLLAAGERAGTYTVNVTADAYAPFERTGVRVEAGVCHVSPVEIDVRLQPRQP